MNWGLFLQVLLKLTPYVVSGIELVHKDDVDGKTKKQMAIDALGVATRGAVAVDPGDEELTQTIAGVTGAIIDSTVSDMNAKGVFKHGPDDSASVVKVPILVEARPAIEAARPAEASALLQHTGAPS